VDESTQEAIGDWHYWISQGYCLWLTHGHRKLTDFFLSHRQFFGLCLRRMV